MGKFNKKINKSNLSPDKFLKLLSIFNEKNWNIDNSQYSDSIFDDFCSMLSKYDTEQQDLIIELTDKFLWLGLKEYPLYLKKLFKQISADNNPIIDKSEVIVVVPLCAPKDFGKVKSSSFLSYLIKGDVVHIERLFANKKIFVFDNYDSILDKMKNVMNFTVFLVDDYVGTGDTAEEAINYLVKNGFNRSNLIIATLISQQVGYDKLLGDNITIYSSEIRNKGITDSYSKDEAVKRFTIMESIEKKIKVFPEYKFGYGQSEALISLTRTPNNTFPVFWLECKKVPTVPFARRG